MSVSLVYSYLVDRGNLVLFQEELNGNLKMLSMKEAYELMVNVGISMARYQVYAHLKRNGYIVRRFPSVWKLSDTDDPSIVWEGWSRGRSDIRSEMEEPKTEVHLEATESEAEGGCSDTVACSHEEEQHDSREQGLDDTIGTRAHDYHSPLVGCSHCPVDTAASPAGNPPPKRHALPFPRIAHNSDSSPPLTSQLVFDVFKPNSNFKRRQPGLPMLRVCMPSGRKLRLQDIVAAEGSSDGVHVTYAIVDNGDIVFFDI
ncbi:unnamed protein product [Ostreobium quekettii]|uniref:tRNA-splicing endonuclease subunit Sen54 N-terminal domain-containing protein n=1 Tax=Ostreobium quekettii TaxID=121088 RepID=A0A8S1J447_9CHLO|nr:unnamed protein product [Ostreobium quekettii]|eukprot:evm.model.scf_226EXC.11 EVM.evm.TU.scf_226EXC.11   scf_226EXC:68734-70705(+)